MKAVFLSDAHLWSEQDKGYRRLVHFLGELEGEIDHLVVAGDFFDFWFCDGQNFYSEFRTMVDALVELKKSGADVSLIEGNHDFFMEQALGEKGIRIYRDEAILDFGGTMIYAAHGDLVDRKNSRYLLLRRVLRSTVFFHFQKWLPLPVLWRIARASSNSSRRYKKENTGAMVEAMIDFARRKISEGMDAVVLGHSHQQLFRHYVVGEQQGVLVLLGDWIDKFSYLLLRDGSFSLECYDDYGRRPQAPVL